MSTDNNTPKFYTSKDKVWVDPKGMEVPFSRVFKPEKLKEKACADIHALALKAEQSLKALNDKVYAISDNLYKEAMAALHAEGKKQTKGNFTYYNFDRSFKVEIDMQDRLEYDSLKMDAAKAKFDQYIAQHTQGNDELIVALIGDAFTNSKGSVDHKKVQNLLSYQHRFKGEKYALWHDGCNLLAAAGTVVSSKRYTRIFVRNAQGEYQALTLNFSSL